jgi:5-methyltetrahydropteroyltriglutamate--homocysteine methyltransferase
MNNGTPPFRADHVGSLLRPAELLRAREQRQQESISAEALREIEDRSIRDIARLQEEIGLQGITDGEYRRTIWHADFLRQIEGVSVKEGVADGEGVARRFQSGGQEIDRSPTRFYTTGQLRRSHGIKTENFKYLASVTSRTPKLCIPSPTILHMRGGRDAVDSKAYPDMDRFFSDLAQVYRQEIRGLAELGCTYWAAEGGYDPVAEILFNEFKVDGFFLEYDSARAGSFSPLRFVPKDKQIVLGLVTTKTGEMETADELKRRIDEAARYVALEQLALSPQCGFSSTVLGNNITVEAEIAKLSLVVRVAGEVWA